MGRRSASKTCFFITPIGPPGSEDRKRADQIQKFILTEVLAGKYKIVRADELPHPGSITQQIISLLYNAHLVVADLTGSNPNVAYELAVRHAFNKVSIHLIDKADKIPFDLKDERTIVFDLSDLDSIKSCKDELQKVVGAILNGKVQYSSPVFRTLGLAAATTQEMEGFLEKVTDQLDSIATDVSSIETTLLVSEIEKIDSINDRVVEIESRGEAMTESIEEIAKGVESILARLKKPTR